MILDNIRHTDYTPLQHFFIVGDNNNGISFYFSNRYVHIRRVVNKNCILKITIKDGSIKKILRWVGYNGRGLWYSKIDVNRYTHYNSEKTIHIGNNNIIREIEA